MHEESGTGLHPLEITLQQVCGFPLSAFRREPWKIVGSCGLSEKRQPVLPHFGVEMNCVRIGMARGTCDALSLAKDQ
jgi:hypothetical protein